MIINNTTLESLRTTLSLAFQKGYDQAPTFADKIARQVGSNTKISTYSWMDMLPKMREWVGPRQYNNLIERAQQVTNKDYESSVEVSRNDIEDDNLGNYGIRTSLLGRSARKHKDYLLRDVIVAATSTVCFDGQFFFDTDHPVDMENSGAGTQSNKFSLALTADNINTNLAAMKRMLAKDGEPIGAFQGGKEQTLLIVPPELEKTADEAVSLRTTSGGGDNPLYNKMTVVSVPELTDTTRWYMFDMSFPGLSPFMIQERQAVRFAQQTSDTDDVVFTSNKFRYGLHWRGNAFGGLYWLACTSKP